MNAAGSFRRERETGVLELLLVSPLNEWQIIGGRLRGLWGQFLPAMVALGSIWLYSVSVFPTDGESGWLVFVLSSFLTLPVIGLYFSLRRANFMSAFPADVAVRVGAAIRGGRGALSGAGIGGDLSFH